MRHRRRERKRWERAVALFPVIMLAIPTSLILFSSELLWQDNLAADSLLLAFLTIPPLLALWLVERRRGRQREPQTE